MSAATYMYGKEAHDAIDPQLYRLTFLRGTVEIREEPPGFMRTIHRDGDGNVTRDETKHYVCLGESGGNCMFCGREMGK